MPSANMRTLLSATVGSSRSTMGGVGFNEPTRLRGFQRYGGGRALRTRKNKNLAVASRKQGTIAASYIQVELKRRVVSRVPLDVAPASCHLDWFLHKLATWKLANDHSPNLARMGNKQVS
jgi:hypothetical protein